MCQDLGEWDYDIYPLAFLKKSACMKLRKIYYIYFLMLVKLIKLANLLIWSIVCLSSSVISRTILLSLYSIWENNEKVTFPNIFEFYMS